MILKAKASKSPIEVEADVCIVGSGAGGAVMAKELAEGGLSVVVLEKGERTTQCDFDQKEETMFPRFYEDAGMRATADQSILLMHAKAVGGTTVFNDNICFRAHDFVLREWVALGIENISPESMGSYYAKVERELSVSEIKDEEVSRNDQVFHRGAERLGLKPKRFRHNRENCIGCGFCYIGCSYGRKKDMPATYIPKAETAGARIFANTEAEAIERKGDRVLSILASEYDPKSKALKGRMRVRAKRFIVAGGAISTPVLLLRNGFGRLNPHIGDHLSLHPMLPNLGVMSEKLYFYEGIPQCEYVDCLDAQDSAGFLLEGIGAHPILVALALSSFGKTHRKKMEEYGNFSIHYVMIKDRPQGKVSVGRNGSMAVSYRLHPRDKQSLLEAMKLSARIYFAAGAKKVYLNHVDAPALDHPDQVKIIDQLRLDPNRMTLYSPHQFSTCRMGTSPKTSVTDPYGRVHGMENLYVSDSSLFPTALGYNPQLTIMALATRNAAHLLAHPAPRAYG